MTMTVAVLAGLHHMLGHPFMRYAFVGGTGVALAAGLVGYFVVLRSQVFVGDALSHVAFTGAMAALVLGVDLRLGLYATTIAVAVGIGALGRRGRADDVVIGSVFAFVLGIGVLFLHLFTTSHSTSNGAAGVRVLFGSIFGLSRGQAVLAAVVGLAIAAAVVVVARPLLFATIDEAVAARGAYPCGGWDWGSSPWPAPARPRPARPSARCSCSACWRPPRAPPYD